MCEAVTEERGVMGLAEDVYGVQIKEAVKSTYQATDAAG
jgi:hypothetical protein